MVFGQPSENEPWGFTFFGHHLCLNVFLVGNQMTIAPTFVGSEPNVSLDKGAFPLTSNIHVVRLTTGPDHRLRT